MQHLQKLFYVDIPIELTTIVNWVIHNYLYIVQIDLMYLHFFFTAKE